MKFGDLVYPVSSTHEYYHKGNERCNSNCLINRSIFLAEECPWESKVGVIGDSQIFLFNTFCIFLYEKNVENVGDFCKILCFSSYKVGWVHKSWIEKL